METSDENFKRLQKMFRLLVMSNAETFLDKVSIRFGCYTLSVLVDENDTVKNVADRLLYEIENFYIRHEQEEKIKENLRIL